MSFSSFSVIEKLRSGFRRLVHRTQEQGLVNVIGSGVLAMSFIALAAVAFDRYQSRQSDIDALDVDRLQLEIDRFQQRSDALYQASPLNPVWDNWAIAKKTALNYGVILKASKEGLNRSQNIWSGSIVDDPLVVLAVAGVIQRKVPMKIHSITFNNHRAVLEFAVVGTVL